MLCLKIIRPCFVAVHVEIMLLRLWRRGVNGEAVMIDDPSCDGVVCNFMR